MGVLWIIVLEVNSPEMRGTCFSLKMKSDESFVVGVVSFSENFKCLSNMSKHPLFIYQIYILIFSQLTCDNLCNFNTFEGWLSKLFFAKPRVLVHEKAKSKRLKLRRLVALNKEVASLILPSGQATVLECCIRKIGDYIWAQTLCHCCQKKTQDW